MKKTLLTLSIAFLSTALFSQVYTNAESVEYDPVNDQWLVSNGSRMIADDGNGNLSFFGTGPSNLGVEVLGNTVFASVSDGIVGYDLTTEAEVMNLPIAGASFLNGLTSDGVSTLYTTEFTSNMIFSVDVSDLSNPVATEIVADTQQQPNGILFDGDNNRLLFVTWTNPSRIKAVDLTTFIVTDITTTNVGNIDGIDDDELGNYYLSSWGPARITKYNNDFSTFETVVTPALDSPADIGYNQDTDVLAIPMFDDVIFVDLTVLSNSDIKTNDYGFGISCNPINDSSYIQFDLKETQPMILSLYDVKGRLIKTLLKEPQGTGVYKVMLAGLELPSGLYLVQLQTGSGTKLVEKVIVE